MIDSGDQGDIPQFIESIQLLKPKFFIMDNLPKSLISSDWNYYGRELPGYDIHFEWINNYGYGNIQKNRKRLFVIGSKKELGFYFIPGEFEHSETIRERISNITPGSRNNNLLDLDVSYECWRKYMFDPSWIGKSINENRITLREFQERIKDFPSNSLIPYYNQRGERKLKLGYYKVNLDRFAPTMNGGGSAFDNNFKEDTLYPFTIRERAKIQGCPDNFIFLPENITHTCKEYSHLIKQTGKFMPVEFCTFITQQIMNFLEGIRDEDNYTQARLIGPNPYVDENKFQFCQMIGYENSKKVCNFCGSKEYCKKHIK